MCLTVLGRRLNGAVMIRLATDFAQPRQKPLLYARMFSNLVPSLLSNISLSIDFVNYSDANAQARHGSGLSPGTGLTPPASHCVCPGNLVFETRAPAGGGGLEPERRVPPVATVTRLGLSAELPPGSCGTMPLDC